ALGRAPEQAEKEDARVIRPSVLHHQSSRTLSRAGESISPPATCGPGLVTGRAAPVNYPEVMVPGGREASASRDQEKEAGQRVSDLRAVPIEAAPVARAGEGVSRESEQKYANPESDR